jgi:shikimate 5-dehydrogenase
MDELGLDLRLVGRDLPLDASDDAYRELVAELVRSSDVVGAVITSHKLRLLRAAGDLIGSLDPLAEECGEVNALRKDGGRLAGFARDPVSVGRVVDEIWPEGAHVVCLGAGGTAVALGRHLLARPVPPPKVVFADRNAAAAAHLREVLGGWASGRTAVEVLVGDGTWDALVAASPPGTLVVNATGLGKDAPGCPVSAAVRFPRGATVWDLNYRGDLAMLRYARRDGLVPHDGWSLFNHGWAAALGPILALPDDAGTARRFARVTAHLHDA